MGLLKIDYPQIWRFILLFRRKNGHLQGIYLIFR